MRSFVVVLLLLQDSAIEWRMKGDQELSFTWKYTEKAETAKDKQTTSRSDVREVEGRLKCAKEFRGTGVLAVSLQRVTWTWDEDGLEARLAAKRAEIVKRPEGSDAAREQARLKAMTDALAPDYRFRASSEQDAQFGTMTGKTFTGGRNATALFRGAYVHGSFPGELDEKTEWYEAVLGIRGLDDAGAETAMIRMKVTSATREQVTVAGEYRDKFHHLLTDCVPVSGTLSVRREYVFARGGRLVSSREEVQFKRHCAGETRTLSVTQELTLK